MRVLCEKPQWACIAVITLKLNFSRAGSKNVVPHRSSYKTMEDNVDFNLWTNSFWSYLS